MPEDKAQGNSLCFSKKLLKLWQGELKMSEEDKKHIKITYNDDRPFSHQTFLKAMEFNLLINFWLDNGLEGFEKILRQKDGC